MTQENRFAIIIGFAMLLIVGILVSDHLAEVVRGEPGSMLIDDPLGEHLSGRIEYQPLVAAVAPKTRDETIPVESGMRDPAHTVAAGESLYAIATRYYGEPSLAEPLARHNAIPNPDRLDPGLRLMIPSADRLVNGPASAPTNFVRSLADPSDTTTPEPEMLEYEVQSGDTLSELAQQLMGTAKATQKLLDLNRDRLTNPDVLAAGIRLRYPSTP